MPVKPDVTQRTTVAQSRLFRAEELHLTFSNGEERVYEKLCSGGPGAVLMVPMVDDHTVLMVREYAGGLEDYHLSLPKGAMDRGETPEQAANRELKEEVGYGADNIHWLKKIHLSPSYMEHKINVLIMRDLYAQKLPGDEPEPLEVVPCNIDDLMDLVMRDDVIEGRTIAALFMAKAWLEQQR
ncbi:ADP compounds hydrolase NudE [Gilvimarinus xylanilyticus]|uniref:ADP compounds hydrolase NudE n=1 Tax=Gilvimarinus xylanilyticus TaxID=2944139 RepID=A0A9X2I0E3_9GAMM|nr:ADP compounds hydrolase NudE [Gilvimarinus xylanilyticus]MCP8900384.1 ADP compounds hydrolase NudE [Gilvimarinus xylanilyticus]